MSLPGTALLSLATGSAAWNYEATLYLQPRPWRATSACAA